MKCGPSLVSSLKVVPSGALPYAMRSTLVSAPLTTEIATTKEALAVAVAAAPALLVSAWA